MSEAAPAEKSIAQAIQRRRLSGIVRGALWLTGFVVVAFFLVAVLVVVQGRYSEVRRADAILVLPGACASLADGEATPCGTQLDYALDLYRRHEYGAHLALMGQEVVAPSREYLLAKGFPEEALLLEDQETTQQLQLRRVAQLARERGVTSMLIVGAPTEMLVALKMTRDLGLATYGAPLPGLPAFDLLAVARETIGYWRYVLFGV